MALAYVTALVALMLWEGSLDGVAAVIGIGLFLAWHIGPVLAAAIVVKASRTRAGQGTFLLFQGAIMASTMLAQFYCLEIAPDPQGPIFLFIFLPLYQYGAFLAFLILAALFGWRAREEWLRA